MNDKRTWRFQYRLPKPLLEGGQSMTLDEAERGLNRQLDGGGKGPIPVLWELARLYNATNRQDQALQCLRRVMEGESEVEAKAHCVLALGATMEQTGDYPSAIRFYREAFAVEPTANNVWYFINNNLGYSYSQVGQHSEAEKFCRAAIAINPDRHNAYKNLGVALQKLGHHREAALNFVTATQKNANDPRAVDHLERLLESHPELNKEFASDLAVCQRTIRYVAEAARRAGSGIALKVLLGGNDEEINQSVVAELKSLVRRGSVEAVNAKGWEEFTEEGCAGACDLIVLAPQGMTAGEKQVDPLPLACDVLKQVASRSPAPVVVLLERNQVAEWREAFCDVGADAVVALPFHPNALAAALKSCTQGYGGDTPK